MTITASQKEQASATRIRSPGINSTVSSSQHHRDILAYCEETEATEMPQSTAELGQDLQDLEQPACHVTETTVC